MKNLPANAGDMVLSLGQEDPLEKETATHPSILAWRIPWIAEPGGLQSIKSDLAHIHVFLCNSNKMLK